MAESTRTVERALDILLCFTRDTPVLTLTQIAERVGLHKSTVHRLLATLENKHFIHRDRANSTYCLGIRLIELGFSVLKNKNVSDQATPYMQRLSVEHRETVDLAILEGSEVVYLQVIESSQRMKIAAAPGERLPAFCTATGKAFLAYTSDAQARRIFKQGLREYTQHTNLSINDFLQSLQATRKQGFAVSVEEYEEGINAVAAPILDANLRPMAAIAIVGPASRMPMERMMRLGKSVKSTADEIAQEMGLVLQLTSSPAQPDILL